MSDERILRYEVPVDDRWHRLRVDGVVAHVGCRIVDVVEFWTTPRRNTLDGPMVNRREYEFRVYGTGQPLDGEDGYLGTTYAPGGALVWHLFSRPVAAGGSPE